VVGAGTHRLRTSSLRRRGIAWTLAAATALAVVGFLQTPAGRSGLHAVGATGSAGGFTELAIARGPKATVSGRTLDVTFAIAIHDVQGAAVDYRWRLVTIGGRATGSPPRSGTVSIGPGLRRTVQLRAAVRCDDGAARTWVGARVDPQPAQSVGTWLACPGAPA
jgi:hypothetical protein